MPAYFIADIEVLDRQEYEHYRAAASSSIAQCGGKYLVRGGSHEVLEGEWQPRRLVVLEFESMAAAKRWYESPEYQTAKVHRERSAKMNGVLVEGIEQMTGYERAREG